MIPKPHEHESVLGSVVIALIFLTVYALAFTWLFWVMTPTVFWHLVFWLKGFRP